MPNVELLEKTLQFIKDHPEKHDQTNWCGTAQCFAGWAAELTGWTATNPHSMHVTRDHMFYDVVDEVAADELNISEADANVLFDGDNGIAAIEHIVKDLINGTPLLSSSEYQKRFDV